MQCEGTERALETPLRLSLPKPPYRMRLHGHYICQANDGGDDDVDDADDGQSLAVLLPALAN